jgi:hypothetical protein
MLCHFFGGGDCTKQFEIRTIRLSICLRLSDLMLPPTLTTCIWFIISATSAFIESPTVKQLLREKNLSRESRETSYGWWIFFALISPRVETLPLTLIVKHQYFQIKCFRHLKRELKFLGLGPLEFHNVASSKVRSMRVSNWTVLHFKSFHKWKLL